MDSVKPSPRPRRDDRTRIVDAYLLLAARAGDRPAAERLARRWTPRLLRTARRFLGDAGEAEDAVQECWTRIWRRLPRLRDAEAFAPWAFAILHKACVDRVRRAVRERKRETTLDGAPERPTSSPPPDDAMDAARAIALLKPHLRVVAVLFYGEGLSLAEICQALDLTEGAAKSRLFQARRAMKARLNPKGDL